MHRSSSGHRRRRDGGVARLRGRPWWTPPLPRRSSSCGHERPEVVVLSADLSKYTDVAPFAQAFPERFFQVGMAEQNLMGIRRAGLAQTGLVPVAATYCVFATQTGRRPGPDGAVDRATAPPWSPLSSPG